MARPQQTSRLHKGSPQAAGVQASSSADDSVASPPWTTLAWEARLLAGSLRKAPVTLLHGGSAADRRGLLHEAVLPLLGRRSHDLPAQRSAEVLQFPARTPAHRAHLSRRLSADSAEVVVLIDDWDAAPLPSLAQTISAACSVQPAEPDAVQPAGSRVLLVLEGFERFLALDANRADVAAFRADLLAGLQQDPFGPHLVIAVDDASRTALGLNVLLVVDDAAQPALKALGSQLPGFGEHLLHIDSAERLPSRLAALAPAAEAALAEEPSADPEAAAALSPVLVDVELAAAVAVEPAVPDRISSAAPMLPDADWLASLDEVVARVAQHGRPTETPAVDAVEAVLEAPVVEAQLEPPRAPEVAVEPPRPVEAAVEPPVVEPPVVETVAEPPVVEMAAEPPVVEAAVESPALDIVEPTPAVEAAGDSPAVEALPPAAAETPVSQKDAAEHVDPLPEPVSTTLPIAPAARGSRWRLPFGAAALIAVLLVIALVRGREQASAEAPPLATATPAAEPRPQPTTTAAATLRTAPAPSPPSPVAAPVVATKAPVAIAPATPAPPDPGKALVQALAPLRLDDLRAQGAEGAALLARSSTPTLALLRYDALQALPQSRALEPMRLVAPLFVEPLQAWVRADSPLQHWHQLRGKLIDIGRADSGAALSAGNAYEALFGSRLPAQRTSRLNDAAAAAALQGGRVDALLRVGSVAPAPDLRALTLDPADASTGRALRSYLPTAAAVGGTQRTLGVMSFLVSRGPDAATSDTLAGDAMRRLCAALPQLRANGGPAWATARPDAALPAAGRPYAPAALQAGHACSSVVSAGATQATN